jgi:hypothetical protein
MNQTSHITTLRQTHRAATTLLPVLTATLTVAGAMIAALEARAAHSEPAANSAEAAEMAPRGKGVRRMTARAYLATLVGHALLVALGIALVCSLVYVASVSGRVGQAILLTALILLALYLTEKVARRA